MLATFHQLYQHERGYVVTPFLPLLALASYLLAARDAWALALLLLVPLAAGMAGGEKIVTARNIAREPGVLPGAGEREVKYAIDTVQEPTGPTTHQNRHKEKVACYRTREGGPMVYVPLRPIGALANLPHVPKDLVQALQEVPGEAQPMLAAICTLFLEQVTETTIKYHKENPGLTHGAIKTTLRELARRMGLDANSGKNRQMIAEMLGLLVFVHNKDFVLGVKKKKDKIEEISMSIGRFLTWIEYGWKKDQPFDEATVKITICPTLTDFLLSPECRSQQVWIPVDAIKKLRSRARRSRYSIPALFYIMAAKPTKGRPFRISWEKLAEKIGLPERTKSGRKVRPSEKRKLIQKIMKEDIAETGLVSVEEDNGMFIIHYPRKGMQTESLPEESSDKC